MSHPVLRAAELTKIVVSGDAPLTILDGVSFDVDAGASVAIVGASGSGKTTLLGLLAGLDRATSGDVWLDGHALSAAGRGRARGAAPAAARLRVPVVPAAARAHRARERDAAARARRRGRRRGARRATGSRASASRGGPTHYPKQLSGGEQQRVAIARAFAGEPTLLLADEPTGNLDAATGAEVADLMFRLNHEHATTLVLVTHDVAIASRCGRRLSLASGRLVADERVGDPLAA